MGKFGGDVKMEALDDPFPKGPKYLHCTASVRDFPDSLGKYSLCEPYSKLLISPLISPLVVPHILRSLDPKP